MSAPATSKPDANQVGQCRNGENVGSGGGTHSLQRMVRRRSMCIECPFRPPIENAIDMAGLLDVEFTCHMEDSPHVMGDSRIQCRGHWEAVRKYKRKSPNEKLSD